MLRLGLKNKIVIAIVVVIALFGTAATYFVFTQTKSKIETLQSDYLKVIAIDQAATIHQNFTSTGDITRVIAQQVSVIDFLSGNSSAAEAGLSRSLAAYNLAGDNTSILLLDGNGTVKFSTDEELIGKNYGFRAYFQRAIDGTAGYDLIFGRLSKEVGYYFSYPVKSASGTIIGVAAVRYPANFIEAHLKRGTLNLYGHYLLADNNGVVLRSANSSEELRSLGRIDNSSSALKDRFGDLQIGELGYADLQSAVQNYGGPVVIRQSKYNSSQEYIFALTKLGRLPFYLILGEERSVFAYLSYEIAASLSVMVIIAIVLIALIIYLLISSFLEPLVKLKRQVKDFDAAKIPQIEAIPTNDEVGDLSRSFVDMTIHLKEAISQTESKIKHRTAQLRKTNKYMIGRELKMIELKKQLQDLKSLLSKDYEDKV